MPDLVNPELIKLARAHLARASVIKESFIPASPAGGDPSGGAAGGAMGGPPGGDPSAGGSAMPGGDPSAGGGSSPSFPPPDSSGGGGGDATGAALQQILQLLQQGGGAGGEAIKPKIDVNTELMQIKNLLAKLCDQAGIQIPASDMVATSDKLTQMGMQSAAGNAGAGVQSSAIAPMQPMQGAAPGMKTSHYINNGEPFDGSKVVDIDSVGLHKASSMAEALLQIRRRTAR